MDYSKVSCSICGHEAHILLPHLEDAHKMAGAQYQEQYPDASVFSALGRQLMHRYAEPDATARPSRKIAAGDLFKGDSKYPVRQFIGPARWVPVGDDEGYHYDMDATLALLYSMERPNRNAVWLAGYAGTGKCLGLGTLVLRYDGRRVKVESVKDGDLLMGPDSKPRKVSGTTRGRGPLYKIIPVKGEPWVCNDAHVLTVVQSGNYGPIKTEGGHRGKDDITDISVTDFLSRSDTWQSQQKLFQPELLEFPAQDTLPVDPYFLGVWFGDGTKSLKGVLIWKPDIEIEEACEATAKQWGLSVAIRGVGEDCPGYYLGAERGKPNNLLLKMREVVGDARRLPRQYLTASVDDRLAFLAGLLDTDGYLNPAGGFEIVQKRRGVAKDIMFLARSLGFRVTCAKKHVAGAEYFRMFVSGDVDRIPLRIARKQAAERKQVKDWLRTGFRIEAIGEGDYAGFALDGDGRFLLGDCTVTHNTTLVTNICRRLNREMIRVNLDSSIARSDLIGDWVVREGATRFQYGLLPIAMRRGAVLLLDEFDLGNPFILALFRPVLEDHPRLVILENGGEVVTPHPDFRVVATANTWGGGDTTGLYGTTQTLSLADRQRFSLFIEMKYLPEEQEKQLLLDAVPTLDKTEAEQIVQVATSIRSQFADGKIEESISPRQLVNWAECFAMMGFGLRSAEFTFLRPLSPSTQAAIKQIILSAGEPLVQQEELRDE